VFSGLASRYRCVHGSLVLGDAWPKRLHQALHDAGENPQSPRAGAAGPLAQPFEHRRPGRSRAPSAASQSRLRRQLIRRIIAMIARLPPNIISIIGHDLLIATPPLST
jgi:hypothetical protein